MEKLDADALQENPAVFGPAARGAEATGQPDPDGPACQMATLSYKTALGFKIAFTFLVLVVSTAAAAALVWAVYKIIKDGADVGAIISGVAGLLGSGAAVFLVDRMNQANRVEQRALRNVEALCGEGVVT